MLRHALPNLFLLAALLGSVPASAAPWGPWGCDAVLAREKEYAYWEATTPAGRRQAREEFFRWIEDLRANRPLVDAKLDFSPAWWNAAFSRKHAPMPMPGRMDPDQLAAVLRSKDGAVYLESLRTAYKISEFRLATSLTVKKLGAAIHDAFVRAGKWTYRNTSGRIPTVVSSAGAKLGRWTNATVAPIGDGISHIGKWTAENTYGRLPGRLRERAETMWGKLFAPTPPKKLSRDLPQYFQIAPRVSNAERARTITLYAALKMRSLLIAGVDFVLPVHLRTFMNEKWIERTLPIFTKLEKNPNYLPGAAELATLRKYGAESAFETRRQYLLANPKWSKGARYLDATYRWAIAGVFATAIGIAVLQTAEADAPITIEEYLDESRHPLRPNQIQLINETVPFPHLAIRIGDVVYSYGYTNMTSSPLEVYVREHEPKAEPDPKPLPRETSETPGSGARVMSFLKRHRSMQVVTLDLAPDETEKMRRHFENLDGKPYDFSAIEADMSPEYRKLRRYLVLQDQKKYKNVTLVNDCASMLVRALKLQTSIEIPKLIDPSPSSIFMYLSAMKLAGTNPKVRSVRLVLGDANQRPWLHLLRNAYINVREARLFYHPASLVLTQGQRAAIDFSHGATDLQYFEEAFLDAQSRYRDEMAETVRKDRDLEFYFGKKSEMAPGSELRESAVAFFAEVYERELAYLESSYTDLPSILGALYKLEIYAAAEQEILGVRTFDLEKSLDDPEFFSEIQDLLESIDDFEAAPKK